MIPGDDNNCSDRNPLSRYCGSIIYPNYDTRFHQYYESKCDKPLLAHDVYLRWIEHSTNLAHLTQKQIQLAAYTGYSLMYRTAAEN